MVVILIPMPNRKIMAIGAIVVARLASIYTGEGSGLDGQQVDFVSLGSLPHPFHRSGSGLLHLERQLA